MAEFDKFKRAKKIYQEQGPSELISRYLDYRFQKSYLKYHIINLKYIRVKLYIFKKLGNRRITDANPIKVIWINPGAISAEVPDLTDKWGFIACGDLEKKPIEEITRFRLLNKRYSEGIPWGELEEKATPEESAILNDIDTEARDRLHEKIQSEGYRPQSELRSFTDWLLFRPNDVEIAVGIDGNGEFFWVHRGRHRLFLAKIIGVPKVPVQVRVRHVDWQLVRYKVLICGKVPEGFEDHPDLHDIR